MSAALLIKAVKFAAAIGVTKVINDVVKTNTVSNTMVQKVMVNVGGFVLGTMIMDKASKHVDLSLKTVAEQIKEQKEKQEQKNNPPEE